MRGTVLGLCGLMVLSAAQAAQRWPRNVCRELAGLERIDVKHYASRPASLATARLDVLMLLEERCGADVKARLAADDAAVHAAGAAAATTRAAYRRRSRDPLYCTTFRINDDMSHMQCD
jgi:hypothetical protein